MVQTGPLDSLASLEERAWPEPRVQKEKRGPRERKATQGRMEWGSQAPPDHPELQAPSSTCQSRTEPWRSPMEPRASRDMQVSQDRPGQRETWGPEASRDPQDPRVRRVNRAWSLAPTAECWPLPRKEPRESPASEDPRVRTDGLGTRERSASLGGRVAPG